MRALLQNVVSTINGIFAKLSPSRLALAGLSLVLVLTSPPTHPEKVVKQLGTQQNLFCKICRTSLAQLYNFELA